MRRLIFLATIFCAVPLVCGGQFVSSVTQYNEGTFATVSGTHYIDTNAAIGKPSPIVGASTAFAGILSPFNSHYETNELVAIGRGGSITLRFAQPVAVTGTPQIGVFTNAAFVDANYPNGSTGTPATTAAIDEYGAERTAVVEVASSTGQFLSLGRVIFDDVVNYYTNAAGPYQFPAPDPAALASFDQPFAGVPTDFNNFTFGEVLNRLNGGAGGTWVSIPQALGLAEIQYLRLSDPMWRLPDGSLVPERPSAYFPPPNQFIKPADLFIDGAVLIPEPAAVGLLLLVLVALRRRFER